MLPENALGVLYFVCHAGLRGTRRSLALPGRARDRDQSSAASTDPAVEQPWAQEGSQPPLYYLTAAGLTGWIDTADYEQVTLRNPFARIGVPGATDNVNLMAHPPGQSPAQGGTALAVYLIRWLSILMGTATVYLTWRLAGAAVPGRPAVALLAAALVAFNPMMLFISASVNNDNLLMLLATLALVLLAVDVESAERACAGG